MKHHPQIGVTYLSSKKYRELAGKRGYLVSTNAAGFRSDREFIRERKRGTFRAVLFGDSQTSGDGVSNSERYSDRLEEKVRGLELFNFGISGTGPDQHLLAYKEHDHIEHDLVIIAIYVENIGRVANRIVKYKTSGNETVYAAKPYFQIIDGKLVPCGVPVPKETWTEQSLPAELRSHVYSFDQSNYASTPTTKILSRLLPRTALRSTLRNFVILNQQFQPLPEYDKDSDPKWILLRAILEAWILQSRAPVLLFPIPHHYYFVAASNPGGYQDRFRELAIGAGCHLYDPLPDLMKFTAEERTLFWNEAIGHFSVRGHEVMADILAPVVERLIDQIRPINLLPQVP